MTADAADVVVSGEEVVEIAEVTAVEVTAAEVAANAGRCGDPTGGTAR